MRAFELTAAIEELFNCSSANIALGLAILRAYR